MNGDNSSILVLVLVGMTIFVLGILLGDNTMRTNLDADAKEECEKNLPRDVVCTWQIPKEGKE